MSLNGSFRSMYRTQSEIVPQASATAEKKLGYNMQFSEEVKKKILWSVSTALNSKEISKSNENYKKYATILAKLVKTIFMEFYNPAVKSISGQLSKFAVMMVPYVILGESYLKVYDKIKVQLEAKYLPKTFSGYIAKPDYERLQPNLMRRNNSLLMMSHSSSSFSYPRSDSFYENSSLNSSRHTDSNSSLNLSSSKNNEMGPLRENFIGDKSGAKKSGSESNLNRLKSSSSSSLSSLMKAKRQISF